MSKPEDIQQDVWDAAVAAFGPPYAAVRLEDIARAILAAKDEERQACLLIIAREQFDRRSQSDDEPLKVKRMALNSMAYVCEVLMEAISQRGDVNTAHKNSEVQ